MVRLTIPNERAPGWNNTLRSHWAKRAELIEAIWYKVIAGMVSGSVQYAMFDCPVDVHVIATFKGRALDSDNICAKLYVDALKGRLLHDDDAKWVRRVTTESRRGKVNQVEIVLTEVTL